MSQNYFSGFGNNSMFGKHTESVSSSDRTQRIKNKQIFMNRKNNRNATFYNNDTKDLAIIDPALEKINEAWKAASEEMYKAQAEGQPQGQPGPDPAANQGGEAAGGEDVQDVDFEEVK